MQSSRCTELKKLILNDTPIIDVRAPVEFSEGAIPGSVNLPILQDDERAKVGTAYKQHGQDAAIRLGNELVSGLVKEQRITAWKNFIQQNPQSVLTCFRGGLRSQTTQAWLNEVGTKIPLIEGGYKNMRGFLLQSIAEIPKLRTWLVISGATGSGKTDLLRHCKTLAPTLDLEFLAKHRGSAFGAYLEPQPTPINFENGIARELIKIEAAFAPDRVLLVEDESRMIGSRCQPPPIFEKLRSSEVIWVDDPIEFRVERILQEYVVLGIERAANPNAVFDKLLSAVTNIKKKLGGTRFAEISGLLQDSRNECLQKNTNESSKLWIQKLLEYYYDPLYFYSLNQRQVQVKFRGNHKDCLEYLKMI